MKSNTKLLWFLSVSGTALAAVYLYFAIIRPVFAKSHCQAIAEGKFWGVLKTEYWEPIDKNDPTHWGWSTDSFGNDIQTQKEWYVSRNTWGWVEPSPSQIQSSYDRCIKENGF